MSLNIVTVWTFWIWHSSSIIALHSLTTSACSVNSDNGFHWWTLKQCNVIDFLNEEEKKPITIYKLLSLMTRSINLMMSEELFTKFSSQQSWPNNPQSLTLWGWQVEVATEQLSLPYHPFLLALHLPTQLSHMCRWYKHFLM